MTREGFEPHQGISAAEAIRMYTLDAAYAQFADEIKGSITPGKLADMVLLSANPVKTGAGDIRKIRVLKTVKAGKSVFAGK
jgi:predicted amidohydrolase YtcJ